MGFMTKLRHQQPSLWHPGLTKDIEDLWEPWMRLVDRLLEDEQLLDTIYEAQGERYPQSRSRGRESQEKIVSVFEPHTEIIRKGKASKPTEFGKLVKIQESENQIISHFEVFAERPSDRQLLVPSIAVHQRRFGRIPAWVAADAGFHSQQNEKAARAMGVRWFSVPNQKTKSAERKRLYRQRWFRRGQRWRTGCEGRISALKRRHGMRRCLYRGFHGMQRWVGLSVIADNVIQIGRCLALQGT